MDEVLSRSINVCILLSLRGDLAGARKVFLIKYIEYETISSLVVLSLIVIKLCTVHLKRRGCFDDLIMNTN